MYVWSISLHIHKKAITPFFFFQEEDRFFLMCFCFVFQQNVREDEMLDKWKNIIIIIIK